MEEGQVLDILKRAQARSRHYADYWEWELDRKRAERGVAQTLIEFLGVNGSFNDDLLETPDLEFLTNDGRRIGIEVAEIVDERAAAANRHAEKKQLPRALAIWSDATLLEALSHRIEVKDKKIASNAQYFDEVWLALATDEPSIDIAVAERMCATCRTSAKHLRRAFVLLGYHPDAQPRFPSGCAVFPINLT